MARPLKNRKVTELAAKHGLKARSVRRIYREGMSDLALKCVLNAMKRAKTHGT